MRIVIDMQGAQTESRFRGIGRYTLAFAQGVARHRGQHDVVLALSGLFPETIEPLRAAFDGVLPQENIRVWHAPGPVRERDPGNHARRKVAELLREAFLASLQPDVIHICSLFEGFVDDAVISIGRFHSTTPVTLTLHDLIPLLNSDHFLKPNPRYAAHYARKVQFLKHAASFLTNSAATRQEALDCLALDASRFVNVSTAIGHEFQPLAISEDTARALREKIGLTRPFVLYIGGADQHKNLPRLIQAWSALPSPLRQTHQLLFAGKMPEGCVADYRRIAAAHSLLPEELQFSGYVSDDDLVQLYNLCTLYVFPSWHEGFGLPALEAMACGAPVIGANAASLPEVIGLEEALFDPFDTVAIAEKMSQALRDEPFRHRLRQHALEQAKKFSWDSTAKRAIAAWEALRIDQPMQDLTVPAGRKPRLAFVSPMPPERTGIADYSAELLPALADYYDIDLVVAQEQVDTCIKQNCRVQDVSWLRANARHIDRIVYQMGNSPFHLHMLPLIAEIPGTVVLHDFYLSGLMAWMELHGGVDHAWIKALYESHGYGAIQDRYRDPSAAKQHYPVNAHILQYAQGIIVHSEYSLGLARQWYGGNWGTDWRVIPHLRAPSHDLEKSAARKQLGLRDEAFLVCCFGFLDPTKLNHRLLQAWLASRLASEKHCHLVFVGENHGGDYGAELLEKIRTSTSRDRIRITGFASPKVFKQYLTAADVAVQLRTQSRGETSGTILDCMNHGLPVIVNSHGSMGEIDQGSVWMLPDEFDQASLVGALEQLWRWPERRHRLGDMARRRILKYHNPEVCARQYAEAIETFHARASMGLPSLIRRLADEASLPQHDTQLVQYSVALSRNHPMPRLAKRLYLDITATHRNDLKTGIERVTRALTKALLELPPEGYRIEPVYLSYEDTSWCYRSARRYTLDLIGCPTDGLEDEIIEPEVGDVLLGLDLTGDMLIQAEQSGLYKVLRDQGVSVYFLVFDLLPMKMPEVFPPGTDQAHAKWLRSVSTFDGVICISKSVADDFLEWQQAEGIQYDDRRRFITGWFHLGADLVNSAPTQGLTTEAEVILGIAKARPTFLMVGTIEPRKGYMQTLEAFEYLWQEGVEVNLIIVGREGWKDLPDSMRRDIPQTIGRLRTHPELNKRLFWLADISDEYLEKVYAASTCLIAASYGEGFGLPLIEAAHHQLPIIARDIPVFREVAGEHAYYFDAPTAEVMGVGIKQWLKHYYQGNHPMTDKMSWLVWKDSAASLCEVVLAKYLVANTKKGMEKINIGNASYLVASDDNHLDEMGNDFETHMVAVSCVS